MLRRFGLKKIAAMIMIILLLILLMYVMHLQETDTGAFGYSSYSGDCSARAQELVNSMSLEEKVYQMFIVSPEQITGVGTVTAAGEATRQALEKYPVGGLLYSEKNIIDRNQIRDVISSSQSYSKTALFTVIDEDGSLTGLKSMYSYRNKGRRTARRNAAGIAENISGMGFNMDLAPCADVWSNSRNTVVGSSAYSDDYRQAAKLIAAAVEGFHKKGVICTLKHFPGAGDLTEELTTGKTFLTAEAAELEDGELRPFRAGIEAGADVIMTGHMVVRAIDRKKPASLSAKVVGGCLREQLGYGGLIMTASLSDEDGSKFGTGDRLESYCYGNGSSAEDVDCLQPGYYQQNGVYRFYVTRYGSGTVFEEVIMSAVPCCPHCHRRLPGGWLTADDYLGISVIAPAGYGKTAFMESLLRDGGKAFSGISLIDGHKLSIGAAQEITGESAFLSADLSGPGGTKTIIIGIYDTENLLSPDFRHASARQTSGRGSCDRYASGSYCSGLYGKGIMGRMDADIYLFDIRQSGIAGIGPQRTAGMTEFGSCRLMSLAEQAEFQRQNAGRVISARELLELHRRNLNAEGGSTQMPELYARIVEDRRKYDPDHLKDMQFIGVVTKIDLIEEREQNGRFAALFDRYHDYDMADIDIMTARNELARELIAKYRILQNPRDFGYIGDNGLAGNTGFGIEYGKGVSWHCVSSLGCDVLSDGTLTGEYRPIRVAEPIVKCLLRRIAENGWL